MPSDLASPAFAGLDDRFASVQPAPFGGARAPAPSRKAEIAAAQLRETIECAGWAVVSPVVLVAILLPFFWHDALHRLEVSVVLGLLAVAGVAVYAICRDVLLESRTVDASAHRVAIGIAIFFGSCWALLPILLYPGADANQRLVLVAALFGAIGNVGLLGAAWPVGLVYVTPLLVGGILGLAAGEDAASLAIAFLVFAVGAVVGVLLDRGRKRAARRILDRLEAGEHAFTIDRLLLDFEESGDEWLWEIDARGRFRDVAPRMAEAAGRKSATLENVAFKSILNSQPRPSSSGDGTMVFLEAIKLREPIRNRVVAVETPNGLARWRLSAKPIHDAEGRFAGFRGLGTDITAAFNAEARIAYLANHDACTGLPNRVSFQAHAQHECDAASQGGRGGALLSLDLDGFKGVNDRLGHAAGDEVLKEVARRLKSRLPTDAMVARLGGDEFAVWVPTSVPSKAMAMAETLIDTISAAYTLLDGAQVEIGASVGIALTPKHAGDPETLMVRADLALYTAKAEGKGLARVFIDEYERVILQKRTLEADLRLALARQEFELHYQPLVDVGTGQVAGFEALIRWKSPTRGFVSPVDFIPAAEAAGLIVAIDRWVLLRACKDAVTWPPDVHVAVNISPGHFHGTDLMRDVQVALRSSGLDPHRLEIEVTEGVFLDTSASAVDTLVALRRLGIRIALDDFGTGYSSLSYLIDFPIDKIKIDRAFVRDFVERYESRAIVDAILSLARKLSIKVVAEGVETSEQALALKLRRCDQIQGYLMSKPRPAGEVAGLIQSVPGLYRDSVPTHVDSALGMALAMKKQAI